MSTPQPPPEPEASVEQRRVAVLIVTRDQHPALLRCLQTLYGAPLIAVVDNGSNDTLGLEEEYPDVKFIRLPRPFGMTKALNLGIRALDAEYVCMLQPTVRMPYDEILHLAETLEAEPATGAVVPLLVDAQGSPVPQAGDLPTPNVPDPALHPAKPGERPASTTLEAIVFRSFFLRALRQIDERYGEYGCALELCQQLRRANKTILVHPRITAPIARDVPPTDTATEADRLIGTSRFLGKHHGTVSGLLFLVKQILRAALTVRLPLVTALVTQKKIDGA